MATRPDLEKFMQDPAFQGDRDFFFGLFDKWAEKKAAEAAAKKAAEEPDNIFDSLFGGSK